eukprot:CAMPEP_0113653844 /NCGR_PEP_ID=MMETSP0017_2-20120614/28817_1 /TAXON_ID=2856 /ORGANISM="Cylindrotheca closterium" /LENGTH=417 /DNA_ID=CAMNT_0000566907 /DNA_START=174 /DNA_END=1424 /DNA_ORIENTATION=+ /assembly_acc=CAM_ASM_000147
MCQLMGMNCNTPTDFTFSFKGFARRGGETDKHEHGWGLAIYEGRGLRTFHDPLPAAKSRIADFVSQYPIQTLNMMAHIRYATQGTVSLENVHPFQREMWGIQWSFAHNGEVPKFTGKDFKKFPRLGRCKELFYYPVGETDSEAVFCAILNALRAEFPILPTLPNLYETIQRLCAEIVEGEEDTTILNFLLGCGKFTQFAYSWPGKRPGSKVWNGLFYTIRKPPFATATLKDVDYAVDFTTCTNPNDRVAVIATAPLTSNEEWREFKKGELLMFDNGWGYSELYDCHEVEQQGRGLVSNNMPKQCGGCPQAQSGFNAPTLLRNLVDEYFREQGQADSSSSSSSSSSSILPFAKEGADLGCGSGCSGLAFRDCVTRLTGVDISPEMIDRAKLRGCYDNLLVGDIETAIQDANSKFDIVF